MTYETMLWMFTGANIVLLSWNLFFAVHMYRGSLQRDEA